MPPGRLLRDFSRLCTAVHTGHYQADRGLLHQADLEHLPLGKQEHRDRMRFSERFHLAPPGKMDITDWQFEPEFRGHHTQLLGEEFGGGPVKPRTDDWDRPGE